MALYTETSALSDIFSTTGAGRMVRSRYGAALAVWVAAIVLAGGLALGLFPKRMPVPAAALAAVSLYFLLTATSRRLHDMGRSGLWALPAVALLPLAAVPLLITESRAGANQWGENPKGRLRVDDPRLMEKLAREARRGSVMDEIGNDPSHD